MSETWGFIIYWHHIEGQAHPAAAQIKQAEEYAFCENSEGPFSVGSSAGLQAAYRGWSENAVKLFTRAKWKGVYILSRSNAVTTVSPVNLKT